MVRRDGIDVTHRDGAAAAATSSCDAVPGDRVPHPAPSHHGPWSSRHATPLILYPRQSQASVLVAAQAGGQGVSGSVGTPTGTTPRAVPIPDHTSTRPQVFQPSKRSPHPEATPQSVTDSGQPPAPRPPTWRAIGGIEARSACRCRAWERPPDALPAWCPIAGGGRSWATVVGCPGVTATATRDWPGCAN